MSDQCSLCGEALEGHGYWNACQTPERRVARLESQLSQALRELGEARVSWRCYHCDEVFTDIDAARDHFGIDRWSDAACQLNREEGGLARQLRDCEARLASYQAEDGPKDREMHAMTANHGTALRREEEKGYARGIDDMRADRDAALRSTAELRGALEQCARKFRYYEQLHRENGSGTKAAANRHMAEICDTALASSSTKETYAGFKIVEDRTVPPDLIVAVHPASSTKET